MGELELIERIRAGVKTRNPAVRVGIGDDCAVLRVLAGQELVVTTDMCLEGRHFRRDWHSPESAGHRCLARGLSDIAAMGAKPVAAFLSLALPHGFDESWVAGFLHGFQTLAESFSVELAGGDTGESPGGQVLADVVVVGTAARGKAMRRSGARVGDGIYCTGTLGGSAAELERLAAGGVCAHSPQPGTTSPQCFPEPRVAVGLALAKRGWATSGMDISDGLSTDLRHLCAASGVRGEIDLARLPLAAGATLEQALHGGEDYELVFTAMAGLKVPVSLADVPVRRIGTVVAGAGVGVSGGGELMAQGFEHLR